VYITASPVDVEDGGAVDPIVGEVGQCLIGLIEQRIRAETRR